MDEQVQSRLRLLAPAALVVFAVLLLAVVVVSIAGSAGAPSTEDQGAAEREGTAEAVRRERRSRRERELPSARYTVKVGDTLGSISQKTGRSPQDLQDLNEGLDAQALQPGQRLKLRE